MKKLTKRITCFFFAVLVLCVCFPFSAFAVDPVSAGVMANAFAQAIAAYGAANGAAMTFDVSNTSSIGETVHELWADFRAGTQDADDYETLAAALFPDLYYKAVSAAGTALEAATIGYNISSEYAEEFDNFWNWLLSGPAEMTKVDNQYYQFQQSQIGIDASSIPVYRSGLYPFTGAIPQLSSNDSAASRYQNGFKIAYTDSESYIAAYSFSSDSIYVFCTPGSNNSRSYVYVSLNSFSNCYIQNSRSNAAVSYVGSGSLTQIADTDYSVYSAVTTGWGTNSTLLVPEYSTQTSGYLAFIAWSNNPTYSENVGVKAYDNTGVASFPDTTDPNYDAVAKRIPSDVPWDDSLFGDGTGTMTDAQSQAAAETADDVIERDKTLPLAGDQTTNPPSDEDPPSSDPDDYMVLGLEDVFPFCIPFDIYNFLAALSAAPVAPHFVCNFDFPDAIGGEQTIDIDFDTPVFNQLAQLLRTLELLAFIVGLALLTRSMFIRG